MVLNSPLRMHNSVVYGKIELLSIIFLIANCRGIGQGFFVNQILGTRWLKNGFSLNLAWFQEWIALFRRLGGKQIFHQVWPKVLDIDILLWS